MDVVKSQNGWPVNPPRRSRLVPGSLIRLVVADGPAGDLLLRFAAEFDYRVEDIDTVRGGQLDDWGWADREIRGGGDISNHASATAVDLNATRHVLGQVGTFTPSQRAILRLLLGWFEGVIRWGGDYTGRKDEMHFEIVGTIADVLRVLNKVSAHVPAEPERKFTDMTTRLVRGDSHTRIPGSGLTWGDVQFLVRFDPSLPGGAIRRWVRGGGAQRVLEQAQGGADVVDQAELDKIPFEPGGELKLTELR